MSTFTPMSRLPRKGAGAGAAMLLSLWGLMAPSLALATPSREAKMYATCKPFSSTDPDAEFHACVYSDERGNKMRVELASGKVSYINPERSAGLGTITLSGERAVDLALSVVSSFGVPMDELSRTAAQVKALRVTSKDEASGQALSRRTELHVGVWPCAHPQNLTF